MRRGVHRGVEGIAPNDLVQVRRGDHAGVDQGVQAVDDELRALEAQHRHYLAGAMLREERYDEGLPLHRGRFVSCCRFGSRLVVRSLSRSLFQVVSPKYPAQSAK